MDAAKPIDKGNAPGNVMVNTPGTSSISSTSTITCPACGHAETETMPTNACQFFYDCRHCGVVLKPEPGDCCVFCSYGTTPCPPMQGDERR